MNRTVARVIDTAFALGYERVDSTIRPEQQHLLVRDEEGRIRFSATFEPSAQNSWRFAGGYTTDRMGHVTSHTTIKDLLAYAKHDAEAPR